ncbi:MAG TPA: tetratricopeptide repeat protein [Candidatus Acidoferrales bacterium]|nr:tetratricopeptide repeat protein [Candidatus Acidoferrales bacterium]
MAAHPVQAQSASEVRASVRDIAGEIAAQKSGGRFDTAAQRVAIDRLGKLALAYIDLSDRAANAGGEAREREALLSAYQAVSTPLDEIYDQNSGTLDRLTKKVMDEDGDLEALYDTQAYKDAQVVASQALYFLNWLHYYGARLSDGAQRKELLEQAQRGFSEFAVGDRHTELLVESLLGRGLCNLELGNTEFAEHDLQAVMNDAQASAERKSKARLALLDAYVRSGKVAEALRLSDEMMGSGGHAEDNLVRFLRIRALLAGAKNTSGGEAERYRQQALTLMDQLRRVGGWEEKVAALAESSIENPEKWSDKANSPFAKWELAKLLVQKGDYKQAMPLLEGFVASSDAEMRRYQGDAHYFLGLAKFQAGQYQDAADQLAAALKEQSPSYGADAAYMRFKALETVIAKSPSAEAGEQYAQAIRDYLARYPDHKSAFEAQFRLGELQQAQHKFADAIQAYAKVHGDPGFELRAQFATLQCDFELLQGNNRREALLQDISAGLQSFDKQAVDYEKRETAPSEVPLNQMHAKVAVMKAVLVTLQPEPNDEAILAALADFEKKYPEQKDLLPQVARLRLVADQHLGRFADAEAEVTAHGQVLLASLGAPAIEDLAVSFIRDGARRNGKGDTAANQAAQQVALRLYEQLVSDSEGSGKAKLTLARLYENTGELEKAAALYSEALQSNGNSSAALRGLGRIAESEKRFADAVGYWRQLGKTVRAGDAPWYESNYEVARLTQAMGKKKEACDQLEELKPAMPGLSDADLRKKLDELYKQACG